MKIAASLQLCIVMETVRQRRPEPVNASKKVLQYCQVGLRLNIRQSPMKFACPSTRKDHIPCITKYHLPFLIAEKSWQLLTIKHLGNDTVGHGIFPRSSTARQFAKSLLQFSLRQMEVERWKKKRFRGLPAFNSGLERSNKFKGINLEGFPNRLLACTAVVTFLMSSFIKLGQISQWHRKNKKVERTEKLLIVDSRDIKQSNSPRSWRLIFAPILNSANREVGCSPKEAGNRVLTIERPIITGRRDRNYFGIYSSKFLEEFLDATV